MNIRRATSQDIEQLTRLKKPQKVHHVKKFHDNQIKRLDDMEKGEAIYLVAEEDGQIIAQLLLKMNGTAYEPDYPNMNDLYVSEEKRGMGIGSKLINEAERIAKEKGYSKVSLAVNPIFNPKAKALYERLGYHRTDTEPYLDGVYDGDEDWVIDMVKNL
jgi:phosphinothricin acetyltransferase